MRGIAVLALTLTLMTACATPQVVKDASRQQGDLLGAFQKTMGELWTKLLACHDEAIEKFRQGLLTSRMALKRSRVSH